ncbi:MAG TPA: group I intron-associated PD-(D/E)XK endonuclease [Candidatus Acidoferrum sp.]|nr:group I intron-associated PD-(D/E)XK endonuclease [Candidatus Acidoferrum sp.]
MNKSRWARIKNRKDLGVWGELRFAARAMEEGLRAARPFGDPPGFDFLVHNNGKHIARVQVKTTTHGYNGWYNCTLKTYRKPYKKDSFDFVAAFVAPEDTWYILPEKLIRDMVGLGLNPKSTGSKYDRFKEAWHLLRREKSGVIDIHGCAEHPAPRIHFPLLNHARWVAPFVLAARFLSWRFRG